MATYSIGDLDRREILKMSAMLGLASVASSRLATGQTPVQRTPEQILGPYYPMKTLDQNADLTRLPGRPGRAAGHVLNVTGRVLNRKGEPVRNAKIEIWQANAHGRYTHPSDPNPAPLDPNFEGSASLTTDSDGRYRFTTIKPAAYPRAPTERDRRTFTSASASRTLRPRCILKATLQQYGSHSAGAGANELHHQAIATDPEMEPESKLAVFDIVLYAG
jgi:protocatechuate 3,4-dioxygenase beta subunit